MSSWSWTEIEALFEQSLANGGVGPKEARELARSIADDLGQAVGGDQPYIPMRRAFDQEEVKRLFTGANYRELARLAGVTPRTIRRWVHGA